MVFKSSTKYNTIFTFCEKSLTLTNTKPSYTPAPIPSVLMELN